jgi:putative membrane protein
LISQPALNAILNGTSGALLVCGYAAIRAGKKDVHKFFMVSAFLVSATFLISYLTYHYRVHKLTLFQGQGWIRPVYFALLISHSILAAAIVPMILVTLRRAWLEKFDKHRLIARWTLPLWIYVSVTGVVVYMMVYRWYAPGS